MTSIRAVGSTPIPTQQSYRIATRANDSTPTPTINTLDRVDKLTRQLDASLTTKLARIRAQISSGDGAPAAASPSPRRLDISA